MLTSKTPSNTRKPVSWVQLATKPIPIITAPQAQQMPARKIFGPILRVSTVAPGWKIVYVEKKTKVAMDYAESAHMPLPGVVADGGAYVADGDFWLIHVELDRHARDGSIGHVRPVHQADAVHQACILTI